MKHLLILLSALFLFSSCEKEPFVPVELPDLVGSWTPIDEDYNLYNGCLSFSTTSRGYYWYRCEGFDEKYTFTYTQTLTEMELVFDRVYQDQSSTYLLVSDSLEFMDIRFIRQ